jgi:putative transposase
MPTRAALTDISSAYQVHVYLCFKTHFLREALDRDDERAVVSTTLTEVCNDEGYRLLDAKIDATHVRLLLSLKPQHEISNAVRKLKGTISRRFSQSFASRLIQRQMPTLWGRGYFARSSGKVDLATVRQYVESQPSHHGYRGNWTEGLSYRNPAFTSPAFSPAHAVTILQYHLVLVTAFRRSVFDDEIARKLFHYVLMVGQKRDFAVDRMTVLPDHIHLVIEAPPTVTVHDCALSLINNTRHWMNKHYSGVLKHTDVWELWRPSYYVGSVGEYTTAQVKGFLNAP